MKKNEKSVNELKMEIIIEKKLKAWVKEALKERYLLSVSVNEKEEEREQEREREQEQEQESWLLKMLPFDSDRIRTDCCSGLTYNKGLLTQCEKKKNENSVYCRGCNISLIGTVEERKNTGLYTYMDRKGHKPKMYLDVLKKMNKSVEEVKNEAYRLGITINPEHLKEKIVNRGRPKKEKEIIEEREDLFACVYLNIDSS